MDDYTRIYGDSGQLPLSQTLADIVGRHAAPAVARLPRHRTAYMASARRPPEEMIRLGLHHELMADTRRLLDLLEDEYDATFGPGLPLVGPDDHGASMDVGHVLAVDFEAEDLQRDSRIRLSDDWYAQDWAGSGFARAARAYRRECGWDSTPGEDGLWLAYCLLTYGVSVGDGWHYDANIAGFLILHDRDDDGRYESLAHIWTAQAARGKGIAQTLVAEARRRYPVSRIEGPITDAGAALFRSAWPEALP